MKKYFVELAVFWCGFAVMVVEILGSRVLAPYFGTTVIVWTSLIGVVLASLSLGYRYGGRLADKNPSVAQFASIIFLSALGIAAVGLWDKFVLPRITSIYQFGMFGISVTSVFVFGPVSFLLAMISPYAVKLKALNGKISATVVGNLYALSTIGSIVGTFLAGFVLVPNIGTSEILFGLFIVTILLSLVIHKTPDNAKNTLLALVGIGLLIALGKMSEVDCGCVELNTPYNRYKVINFSGGGRPIVALQSDAFTLQGAAFTDNDNDLVFGYLKYYRLDKAFKEDIKKALMIGGGVYAFPKDFVRRLPESTIDVVDIDPDIVPIAKEYFHFRDDERIRPIVDDGRIFLNRNTAEYDAIYVDAFNSKVIPHQLTTLEAVEKIHSGLVGDGVVMVNILSAVSGPKSKILASQAKVYNQVFGNVHIFKVTDTPDDFVQNIMLVASKNKTTVPKSLDPEIAGYLKNKIELDYGNGVLATDNYAPTDYLMSIY